MNEHERESLTQEWRAIVLEKLRTLENGQKEMQKELTDLRLSRAEVVCLEMLEDRVRKLEDFRLKVVTQAVTAMAIVQITATILWAVISKIL